MKRRTNIMFGSVLALACVLYCGFCLRAFLVKPPLEFGEFIGAHEQTIISDWYRTASTIPNQPIDFDSVFFAITHPQAPSLYRPLVTYGGLGGNGSVQLTFCSYVAIFRSDEAGLHFETDSDARVE